MSFEQHHRRRHPSRAFLAAIVALTACEGVLDPTDGEVPPRDAGVCDPECTLGWVCQDGRCLSPDDPCVGVHCSAGTTCQHGSCMQADLCEGVVCPNPGDTCQAGECVSGAADVDGDGFIARDDCDDSNSLVHPGSAEACNGRDDDCDAATTDGADECLDLCCGPGPSCQECCEPEQCGDGDFDCTGFVCVCSGRMCDGTCVREAGCCVASDCGTGEWECNDYQCFCPGDITP